MAMLDTGSRSFTCHPHTNHTCLYSPATKHHHPLAGTHCAYPRRDGQAELTWVAGYIHRVSKKNCPKLFLSELYQISTNFIIFWQKDGKEAKIMRGALIFHLIYFVSSHYRVKCRCSKLLGYTMLKVVICNKLSNDLISTQ